MNLISELREKSAKAESVKFDIIAEIKNYFDNYLSSNELEDHIRCRIGTEEIKNRKLPINIEFWAYHSGCGTTRFFCCGKTWTNPENENGWASHYYKGLELVSIQNEICTYIANRLKARMNELGFHLVSADDVSGRLNYYHTLFYFGW